MTPEDARGYIDGLSFGSKQDVWGEFPHRYDHWDAFEAFATVAGLRFEYAVQVTEDGHTWWVTKFKSLTSASWGAVWLPTFNSADILRRECVTELCLQERRAETFVVRKLASEPEVMDPEVTE